MPCTVRTCSFAGISDNSTSGKFAPDIRDSKRIGARGARGWDGTYETAEEAALRAREPWAQGWKELMPLCTSRRWVVSRPWKGLPGDQLDLIVVTGVGARVCKLTF